MFLGTERKIKEVGQNNIKNKETKIGWEDRK